MDDPRQILAEAGVECHELTQYEPFRNRTTVSNSLGGFPVVRQGPADAAILALARLVAKYKWQRDQVFDLYVETGEWGLQPHEYFRERTMADLDRRWEEHT